VDEISVTFLVAPHRNATGYAA